MTSIVRSRAARSAMTFATAALAAGLMAAPPARAAGLAASIVGAASVSPTQTITVTGTGFTPSAVVDLYFDVTDVRLSIADVNGNLPDVTFTVPASAIPGQHWISLVQRSDDLGAQVAMTVNTNWAEYGFNLADTRNNRFENLLSPAIVPQLDTLWTAQPDTSLDTAGFFASPTVVDGVVYLGGGPNTLYAFNAATGALSWSAQTGNLIQSSAAVTDGVVYVGSDDNSLYAFKASNGSKLWSAATGGEVISSPVVVGNAVYVGSQDNKIYAFKTTTGAKLWSAATLSGVISSPAVAGEIVYVGSLDNSLYAFGAVTGAKLWSTPLGGSSGAGVLASPTVADGFVFVGDDGGAFSAFNAVTGQLKWKFTSPAPATYSSAAVAGGLVYVGTAVNDQLAGTVYAFYLEGGLSSQTAWSVAFPSQVMSVTVADGVLYVVDYAGTLRALNAATGAKLWSAAIALSSSASVSVSNGVAYFGDASGVLHAYAPNGAIVTPPRARRPSLAALRPTIPLPARLDEGLAQ